MRKFVLVIMVFLMVIFMTSCAKPEKTTGTTDLYGVILDDIHEHFGAKDGVRWFAVAEQPEGEMMIEYLEECRVSGDLFQAAEKSVIKALNGINVMPRNLKHEVEYHETERYFSAYGSMLGGEMGMVTVTIYQMEDNYLYIKYQTDHHAGNKVINAVYGIDK